MIDYPTLDFDTPLYPDGLPGHHGRATEILAAAGVLRTCTEKQREVWELIRARGELGATYTEVQDHFGDPSRQQRLSDLAGKGLVVDSGRRRRSPRGRLCTVWVVPSCPKNGSHRAHVQTPETAQPTHNQ